MKQMFSVIGDWQQSGLSQKAFCSQFGLRYHVFHYWYKVYRNQGGLPGTSFIKLEVTPPTGTASAELICTDGKRVVFHQPVSAGYLKALIS